MTLSECIHQLEELCALPAETEWCEFKLNKAKPEELGEYLSALSNSAVLQDQSRAWLVWGVNDATHAIEGTTFRPRKAKVKGQELEGWLTTKMHPRLNFQIHEFDYQEDTRIVMFEITPCLHTPVRFEDKEYLRIGSTTRRLRDHPEKERLLWEKLKQNPFELGLCSAPLEAADVLEKLDYPIIFSLLGLPLPENRSALLERLVKEKLIVADDSGRFAISNLGGLLFAKNLHDFDSLSRKALRIIEYKGTNRIEAEREEEIQQGYAAGFERVLENINRQLPTREVVTQTLRQEQAVYPPIAVRELLANALIHQDFSYTGDGPKVEIFTDRVEFTNPGVPLIDTLRFVDEPPRSRNEALARLLRRMRICEERGSGIDRTVFELERHQLPAPDFRRTEHHTVALLFHAFQLNKVSKQDKIRACYYHACLRYVSNDFLTNESFRKRLGLSDEEYPKASRIIRDAIEAGRLKPSDPHSKSRKHAKYLPFWA